MRGYTEQEALNVGQAVLNAAATMPLTNNMRGWTLVVSLAVREDGLQVTGSAHKQPGGLLHHTRLILWDDLAHVEPAVIDLAVDAVMAALQGKVREVWAAPSQGGVDAGN